MYAMIAMAHGLNLKVVAEGTETDKQLTSLKFPGCDNAQGFLLSKPLPEEALVDLLKQSDSTNIAEQVSSL